MPQGVTNVNVALRVQSETETKRFGEKSRRLFEAKEGQRTLLNAVS